MKIGIRKPSIKRRVSARISPMRIVRHNAGLKMPKEGGLITDPKKAVYNRIYNRTSVSADTVVRKSMASSGGGKAVGRLGTVGAIVIGGFIFWLSGSMMASLITCIIGVIICVLFGMSIAGAERNAEKVAITKAIQSHIDKVKSAKTFATRKKNCVEALGLPAHLRNLYKDPKDIVSTEQKIAMVEATRKTLPVLDYIMKGERAN